jgi:hypothetical protein
VALTGGNEIVYREALSVDCSTGTFHTMLEIWGNAIAGGRAATAAGASRPTVDNEALDRP